MYYFLSSLTPLSPKSFLLVIILILGAAAGGYYYGLSKGTHAQKQLTALQQEFDRAQFKLKILVEVRQKLNTAQAQIAQKNFGLAQKEIEAVQKILMELQAKAEPGQKKKLQELTSMVQEIQKGLSALDYAMVGKIEELKQALEKMALS